MSKINDQKTKLKQMNHDELKAELLVLRRAQFNSRILKASGSLEKTHPIRQVKKNIARVKTLITQQAGKSHVE